MNEKLLRLVLVNENNLIQQGTTYKHAMHICNQQNMEKVIRVCVCESTDHPIIFRHAKRTMHRRRRLAATFYRPRAFIMSMICFIVLRALQLQEIYLQKYMFCVLISVSIDTSKKVYN